MSILKKPSENMNVLRHGKLCLSQMDRCVKAVRLEVDSCAERDSLEDGGVIIRYGWKTGSTHLEPVSLTVPPLPELSQWYTSYVSPAIALVIVLALNAKCCVVLLASANGTIPNVGE